MLTGHYQTLPTILTDGTLPWQAIPGLPNFTNLQMWIYRW